MSLELGSPIMLSAILTILLSCIMTLIFGSLVISAWGEHRRIHAQVTQESLPDHPLDRHVTAVLYIQDGIVVGAEKPKSPPVFAVSSPWYTQRRTLFSVGLLLMVLLALLIQGG